MIFIPIWIPNVLLLLACVFSSYQHWRLNRENPIATLQFGVIIFSMVMIVVIVLVNRHHRDAWLSLLFFLVAVSTLLLAFRQFRTLPPKKMFE